MGDPFARAAKSGPLSLRPISWTGAKASSFREPMLAAAASATLQRFGWLCSCLVPLAPAGASDIGNVFFPIAYPGPRQSASGEIEKYTLQLCGLAGDGASGWRWIRGTGPSRRKGRAIDKPPLAASARYPHKGPLRAWARSGIVGRVSGRRSPNIQTHTAGTRELAPPRNPRHRPPRQPIAR
jgi:hypothetical protein